MRTELLIGCKTSQEAMRKMPWAHVVRKVDGGYMGWESSTDYKTWKNQK